jgi:type I restriction enzyme S subunit
LTDNGQLNFKIDPTFVRYGTHNEFLGRSKVFPGDVLINIVGPPLGKVSLVTQQFDEWNINQAIARYRTINALSNKYLMYYLLSQVTINRMSKKAKATAGQFNLTLEICRDVEVPICSRKEQEQIVEEIESRLSICDQLEATIVENLQKAEALRQSILKQAFEGKLVPQDPNDEPAEKLLERIQVEHRKQEQPKKAKQLKIKGI